MKNRWIILLMAGILLCLPIAPALGSGPVSEGYLLMAENDAFALYANPETTLFYVAARDSGATWHACPPDWAEDELARGSNRKLLQSLISLTVHNEKEVPSVHHSYSSSVEKGSFAFRRIPSGFEVDYQFLEVGVDISLRVVLAEDGVLATVINASIRETTPEAFKLGRVSLLPYFDAARRGEDGYLLLPDGSGMLVRFDKQLSLPLALTRPVYGRDHTLESNTKPLDEQGYALPVFGMKRGSKAYLAIIEEGDAVSSITAGIAGDSTSYFRASSALTFRERHTVLLFENSPEENTIQRSAKTSAASDLSVRYVLLEQEGIGYAGMAQVYREYLLARGQMIKRDTSPGLTVSLLGKLRQRKELMGIPYTGDTPLTTYSQAQEILDRLSARGVDQVHISLNGFMEAGLMGTISDSVQPAGLLGGREGLNALVSGSGDGLAIQADLLKIAHAGRGYSVSRDAVRTASGGVAWQYQWDPVSNRRDYREQRSSLLDLAQFRKRVDKLAGSMAVYGIRELKVSHLGSLLYSQLRAEDAQTRDRTLAHIREALPALSDQGITLVSDGAHAYLLAAAARITNMPLGASGFDIQSCEVPFYPMVLSGILPYTAAPSNQRRHQQKDFLRMLEYGAWPQYEVFYAPSGTVDNTRLTSVLSGNWQAWLEQMIMEYETVQALYALTEGSPMVDHRQLQTGLFETLYANGASLLVNYGSQDAQHGGDVIPALWYLMKGVQP